MTEAIVSAAWITAGVSCYLLMTVLVGRRLARTPLFDHLPEGDPGQLVAAALYWPIWMPALVLGAAWLAFCRFLGRAMSTGPAPRRGKNPADPEL